MICYLTWITQCLSLYNLSDTKLTNPVDCNTLDDIDYTPDYLTNYYNPYSFSSVPQDTYLTTLLQSHQEYKLLHTSQRHGVEG